MRAAWAPVLCCLQVVQPLAQQFGLVLAGVVDTQVSAGLLALAAAGSAAAGPSAPSSLPALLARYGYRHISQQLEQLGGSEMSRWAALPGGLMVAAGSCAG